MEALRGTSLWFIEGGGRGGLRGGVANHSALQSIVTTVSTISPWWRGGNSTRVALSLVGNDVFCLEMRRQGRGPALFDVSFCRKNRQRESDRLMFDSACAHTGDRVFRCDALLTRHHSFYALIKPELNGSCDGQIG